MRIEQVQKSLAFFPGWYLRHGCGHWKSNKPGATWGPNLGLQTFCGASVEGFFL